MLLWWTSRESALADRDYLITKADLRSWEKRNGRISRGSIVLLRTGFGQYWPDAERYLGTAERGPDAVPLLHFPGLGEDGARWLVDRRHVKAVGIDTASIDRGQSTDFLSHRVLGAANTPVFENVAHMDQLPGRGFHSGRATHEDRGRVGRSAAHHGRAGAVGRQDQAAATSSDSAAWTIRPVAPSSAPADSSVSAALATTRPVKPAAAADVHARGQLRARLGVGGRS